MKSNKAGADLQKMLADIKREKKLQRKIARESSAYDRYLRSLRPIEITPAT